MWGRVTATTRRLNAQAAQSAEDNGREGDAAGGVRRNLSVPRPIDAPPPSARVKRELSVANTLDGAWDRRIAKGVLDPDFTIDLHGDTLASAHARLNRSLAAAIRAEARVVLLITGKPAPDNPRLPPTSRGVIRASVKDWLATSAHAGQIAAIRGAHPRHGGAGALYLILRRGR